MPKKLFLLLILLSTFGLVQITPSTTVSAESLAFLSVPASSVAHSWAPSNQNSTFAQNPRRLAGAPPSFWSEQLMALSPNVLAYSPTGPLKEAKTDLIIVFDRAMDPDKTAANLMLTPAAESTISWSIPTSMTIHANFKYDTTYRIYILGVAKSGVRSRLPLSWSVTAPSLPPPAIDSSLGYYYGASAPAHSPSSSGRIQGSRGFTLTFDDCGSYSQITAIIAALDARGFKAMMFPTGRCRDQFPWLVPTLIAHGHTVCNHTYSHPVLTRLNDYSINAEIRGGVHANCGYFRPPYGATNPHIAYLARAQGYSQLLWDVDTRDWAGTSAPDMVYMIHAHGGIVLMHFHGFHTVEAIYSL